MSLAKLSARPYLLLVLLCLGLFLPGLTGLPPTDRDESRFAQASKQMLESHDFIRIQFQGESRAKKPAGIYWLQAASAAVTGARASIWAYRLPSLAGALIAVLLTFGLGRRLVGNEAALLGAALLAASLLLVSEAHQAKTDAVQLAAIVAAQGVLARFYLADPAARPGWASALGFWLAQAIGILIKGPILPMVSALTVIALVALDRRAGWLKGLRPLTGLALVAALVAPWAWAINHATAGQFLGTAVKNDLLAKMLGSQESHGAPPGTYLALLMVCFWPASLFLPAALAQAIGHRREQATRFLLAWILPSWLVFELIPTKLPHYVLPVYPALALLAAAGLLQGRAKGQGIASLLWAAVGLTLAVSLTFLPLALKLPPWWTLAPVSVGVALVMALPLTALARHRTLPAAWLAIVAALIIDTALLTLLPSRLEPLWVSSRLAAAVPKAAMLAAAGYAEPSLVFLHGTDTLLTDGGGAADFLALHPDGWAAVEAGMSSAFQARLGQLGLSVEAAGEIDGLDYAKGRPAHITLFRSVMTLRPHG